MAYQPATAIEVRAWERTVGAVARNPATGLYAFEYAPPWLDTGIDLAPLHMPLRSGSYEFAGLSEATYYRLPPLLADALPDAFGNALVDAWMAEQGVSRSDITPLDRLAYASDRAMGALTFRPPARVQAPDSTGVQLADLVTAARLTVTGTLATGEDARDALRQLIQVGTSAGGARAKAVVAFNPRTYQIRSGHLPASEGYEHWLIKLDGVSATSMDGRSDRLGDSAPYGRIEYAYYLMATAAGIEMAESLLMPEGNRAHFMTRRFDRGEGTQRHHFATLCAMAHLDFRLLDTHSYDQYLTTVTDLGLGPEGLAQAYRRMVMNVLAVNRDDHTKNLAFLLPEGGTWQLAPAYDVTHAFNPAGRWTQRHQMSVNGKFDEIALADLHAVGERHQVPGYKNVVRQVQAAVSKWRDFAREADVPDEVAARIADDIDRLAPR